MHVLDDMMSKEVMNDPHRYYHELRAFDPVHFNEKWGGWVLTRYADVVQVFRDADNFSAERMSYLGNELTDNDRERFAPIFKVLANWMLFRDPPDHTRLRRLMNHLFTPKAVEQYRPRVRAIVRNLIDGIERDKPLDLIKDFSYLVPLTIILELLGAPQLDRENIKHWSEQIGVFFFIRADEKRRREIACEGIEMLSNYLRPLVEERRKNPGIDIVSALVGAEENGEVSEDEVVATCVLLVFGGHETTMNLINNGTLAFIRHPDQWELLRQRPELIESAVEEILRYDTSVKATVRWVKNDVQIGGKTFKKDERVLLALTAANRDPEMFQNPDGLDITRTPNPHIAFGQGFHVCLGAALARMEAQEAFAGLTKRLPVPRLETKELEYHPAIVSRALATLPVSFAA
jgi:cytochrome P450